MSNYEYLIKSFCKECRGLNNSDAVERKVLNSLRQKYGNKESLGAMVEDISNEVCQRLHIRY